MSIEPDSQLIVKIKRYIEVRDQRQMLDKTSKDLKKVEDDLELELWTLMESLGLKSVKTDDFGLVTRSFRHNPYVVNFNEFREWVEQQQEFELIREEAKRQVLRDFISSRIKEGMPDAIPPGVEYQTDKIIHIRGREREEDD